MGQISTEALGMFGDIICYRYRKTREITSNIGFDVLVFTAAISYSVKKTRCSLRLFIALKEERTEICFQLSKSMIHS